MKFQGASVSLRSRIWSDSAIGAVDQALLSAFSLAIGVVFIRVATKAEYALYALSFTTLLLLQNLQNALVSSPVTTLASRAANASSAAAWMRAAARVQSWLIGATLATGLVATAVCWVGGRRELAILSMCCAIGGVGVLAREYCRSMHYLRRRPMRALLIDVVYVAAAIVIGAVLLLTGRFAAAEVLALIGVAALVAQWADRPARSEPDAIASRASDSQALKELWHCARWALPSVVNTWIYANAYLYIVEFWMSHAAVAELSATRLLTVPLSLLIVGWSAAFRPRAGRMLAEGRIERVHALALGATGFFVGIGIAYAGLLWLVGPGLVQRVLGDKYAAALPLAWPFLALTTANNVRGVGMACMLTLPRSFRTLFWYGCVALLIALPGVALASFIGSESAVLLALLAAELVLASLIWFAGWPAIRHSIVSMRNPESASPQAPA